MIGLEAESLIHPSQATQINVIECDKAPTKIQAKYLNYANIFSSNLAIKLPKNTGINTYIIKPIKGNQPLYKSIYALSQVELEILKAYIKSHLKTWFIRPSKYPINALILFNKKRDINLCLYVDYSSLNNLIFKNQYLLPLIDKSLD